MQFRRLIICAFIYAVTSVSTCAVVYAAADGPYLSTLADQIGQREDRVAEFRFIQEEAAALGVRAWLFGGTAAGYAHYVKWDMQRESGDPRFQKGRFDYDYTNIYRSTQDADIVIDGTPEQAAALQAAISARYPHLQGSKSVWEVRLLRGRTKDKYALLDDADFRNQNTDSNSTGMIELTEPPLGESRVRDLRDWDSKDPIFLKDVEANRLHYYLSDLHDTTERAISPFKSSLERSPRDCRQADRYGSSRCRHHPLCSIAAAWEKYRAF